MSCSLTEFHRSLQRLAPETPIASNQREFSICEGQGSVLIRYDARPPRTLGGLMSIPDAAVSLTFDGLNELESKAFLARFDRAFQRGGG